MKIFKFNIVAFALLLISFGFTGCEDADPEFVHDDNFITAMTCSYGRTASDLQLDGVIYEYDKDGNLLEPGFTPEQAAGGSGVIMFEVGQHDREDFDLTRVYLRATVKYDAFIYPSLSGLKNILVDEEHPEGLVVAVKSGVDTVRKYRIMGYYE